MPPNPPPTPETPADQLPPGLYYELIHSLCRALPDPLTDSPEDLARRNQAAIAWVASLHPANKAEAELAVLHVTAAEQSKRALEIAEDPETSFEWAFRCRAQANSMMRQSMGALRLLLRLQAARQKTEAHAEASARAAATEQHAVTRMTEAMQVAPPRRRPPPPGPVPATRRVPDEPLRHYEPGMIRVLNGLIDGSEELIRDIVTAGLAVLDRHAPQQS